MEKISKILKNKWIYFWV